MRAFLSDFNPSFTWDFFNLCFLKAPIQFTLLRGILEGIPAILLIQFDKPLSTERESTDTYPIIPKYHWCVISRCTPHTIWNKGVHNLL